MNKRHYEHTLPNIRGSLSNTYDEQQQLYFSDSEQPAYNPKDYEDYIDFPQSMLEPKYSPYQTR